MRRQHLALLSFVMLLSAAAVPVTLAQIAHELTWGVDEGEEFVYALQRRLVNDAWISYVENALPFVAGLSEGQLALVIVSSLDSIPELLEDIPVSYCNVTRENDSVVILTNYQLMVVPIGDWSLLTEAGGFTGMSGVTVIDNEDEWGTLTSGVFEAGGVTVSVYQELRYEKENGTLNYLRLRYSSLGNDLVDVIFAQWHPGMPTVLPAELQMSTLLILATAGTAGFVIAVLVYKQFKSHKPLVRQLGE